MPLTIDEAIKVKKECAAGKNHHSRQAKQEADSLGLAALEAIHFARHGGRWHPAALLPGEKAKEI